MRALPGYTLMETKFLLGMAIFYLALIIFFGLGTLRWHLADKRLQKEQLKKVEELNKKKFL